MREGGGDIIFYAFAAQHSNFQFGFFQPDLIWEATKHRESHQISELLFGFLQNIGCNFDNAIHAPSFYW